MPYTKVPPVCGSPSAVPSVSVSVSSFFSESSEDEPLSSPPHAARNADRTRIKAKSHNNDLFFFMIFPLLFFFDQYKTQAT